MRETKKISVLTALCMRDILFWAGGSDKIWREARTVVTSHITRIKMAKAIEVCVKAQGSAPEFSGWSHRAVWNTLYTQEDGLALAKDHPVCLEGEGFVVERWFESPDAAVASNVSGGWSLLCEERLVMEVACYGGGEKLFLFLKRKDPSTFDGEWGGHRGHFMSIIQNLDIGRIAENTAIPGAWLDNAGAFDFALELWCGDVQTAIRAAQGAGMRAILSGEAAALFDAGVGSLLYLARERE